MNRDQLKPNMMLPLPHPNFLLIGLSTGRESAEGLLRKVILALKHKYSLTDHLSSITLMCPHTSRTKVAILETLIIFKNVKAS